MQIKTKLLGTSPNLEISKKLIAEYWYTSADKITLQYTKALNYFRVFQGEKHMEKYIVRITQARYRFERIID